MRAINFNIVQKKEKHSASFHGFFFFFSFLMVGNVPSSNISVLAHMCPYVFHAQNLKKAVLRGTRQFPKHHIPLCSTENILD